MLIHLLKAYDKANGVNRQGNNADRFFGDKVAVAEAALPLALYFAEHVETYLRKRAAGEAEHHAIETCEAHERQAISELTDMALERWAPLVEGLRATIVDETSSEVDLYDGLKTLVGELRRSIESGKGLLGSGATG